VILVDDGLATGRSALAAVRSLRKRGAARVILAVPVAGPASGGGLPDEADGVVCVQMPADLWAVGQWYEDFSPTTDEEGTALLAATTITTPEEIHKAELATPGRAEHDPRRCDRGVSRGGAGRIRADRARAGDERRRRSPR